MGGHNASGETAARMTVHLVDYARVPASDLKHAQDDSAEIYAAAGIELVSVPGNQEDYATTGH
jgi:hypothetical protein